MTKKIVQIIDALKNQIIDYNISGVGDNVFTSRVLQFENEELPCIAIYFNGLNISNRNEGRQPQSQEREIDCSIFIIVKIEEEFQTTTLEIFGELEKAIGTDYKLGLPELIGEVLIQGLESETTALGETDVCILKADYNINYLTIEGIPDV